MGGKIAVSSILILMMFLSSSITPFHPRQVSAQETSEIKRSFDTTVFQNIPGGLDVSKYSVSRWDPSRTWNGTTIFDNINDHKIIEVNMKGEVVWQYKFPFMAAILGIMVLPNTDILFAIADPEQYRGVYEVNRDGQIVWQYVDRIVAHDAVRLPNGNTLIDTAHGEDYSPWPYTDPEVIEVDRNGNIVWSFHFSNTPFANDPKYKDIRSSDFGYWTHTNEALRLPDGSTLISPRNFNMVIIVDKDGKVLRTYGDTCSNCISPNPTQSIGASMGGLGGPMGMISPFPSPWVNYLNGQTSPIPLANGNLLYGDPIAGRAVEFNTSNKKIVWQWPEAGEYNGMPMHVRSAERLPNGNTLVSDSNGKIFEVTSNGKIVWELDCSCYNPQAGALGPFFQAERVSYMPPTFTLQNPTQGQTYSGTVPFNITEGYDVRKISYSILDNSNNTWIAQNQTALENNFKDSLNPPTKIFGPNSFTLPNGNYTLRLVSSSTGFGYKDFYTPIRINYATEDIQFTVEQGQANQSNTSASNVSIPIWVKNNAKWWSEGSVGDSDFIKGIQYLIQKGILNIPSTASTSSSQQIPQWIKNAAGWWANGQVSDDEFVKGIQYLVSNGILKVKS